MKKIFTLILSFVFGLLCCDMVTAQIYQLPANPQPFQQPQVQPTYIPGLTDQARQVQPPTYIPGLTDQARQQQAPSLADQVRQFELPGQTSRDLLGRINPGSPSLQLPRPEQRPPNVLQIPPIDPVLVFPGQPGTPQPAPQPQPQGPTFEFGPNGPVINFDNGPSVNIPVGQIVDRIRERRQQSPQRGRFLGGGNGTQQQGQQPVYDQHGNVIGYIGG